MPWTSFWKENFGALRITPLSRCAIVHGPITQWLRAVSRHSFSLGGAAPVCRGLPTPTHCSLHGRAFNRIHALVGTSREFHRFTFLHLLYECLSYSNLSSTGLKNIYFLNCYQKGTLLHRWGESNLVQPPWTTVGKFLKKLGLELPHDPAVPLLGSSLKSLRTFIRQDRCTPMLPAPGLTVAETWKQTKCLR